MGSSLLNQQHLKLKKAIEIEVNEELIEFIMKHLLEIF